MKKFVLNLISQGSFTGYGDRRSHIQNDFRVVQDKNTDTRKNIYFLRGVDRKLQYFCNVKDPARRNEICHGLLQKLSTVPAGDVHFESFSLQIKDESLSTEEVQETIEDIIEAYLPEKSQDPSYLEKTVLFVLLMDDPLTLHRYFVTSSDILKL